MGHQRLEVLLVERQDGVVPHRHGGDEPRRQRVPGHVDVPRADRHAGREHRAQRRPVRRADERGLPRPHPLRRRAGAGRRAARRRGPGVRDRADPPRRRPHPPRHAHHRPGAEGARHDVRAGAQPRDAGQPPRRQAVRAGLHRRLLRAARAVPAVRALHRVGDRQVQRLQAGPQGHRHGEGRDADRCCTTSRGGPCRCTARSARPTRCRSSA